MQTYKITVLQDQLSGWECHTIHSLGPAYCPVTKQNAERLIRLRTFYGETGLVSTVTGYLLFPDKTEVTDFAYGFPGADYQKCIIATTRHPTEANIKEAHETALMQWQFIIEEARKHYAANTNEVTPCTKT